MIDFSTEPTVKDYLKSCRRHWVVGLSVLALALAAGVEQSFLAKPVYKATATLLADTSTTDTKDYVDKITVPEVARIVELYGAGVLSDSNLTRMADEMGLFPELTKDPEKRLAALHKAASTEVNGFDTFTVSFAYRDAAVATSVTNRLADEFLERISADRRANGDATVERLNRELAASSARVASDEEALKAFRMQHQGALPGETEGNMRSIDLWQGELRTNTENLQKARQELSLAVANTPKVLQGDAIDEMKAAVAGYEAERRELTALIAHHQALVAQAPEVEGRLVELQREYNTSLADYTDLLKRRSDAAIRVDLDRDRFSQLFRVAEPARQPIHPWRPVKALILGIALLAGLILGAGAAVARDYFDETFREPGDLGRLTGLPVLAAIPSGSVVRARGFRALPPKSRS